MAGGFVPPPAAPSTAAPVTALYPSAPAVTPTPLPQAALAVPQSAVPVSQSITSLPTPAPPVNEELANQNRNVDAGTTIITTDPLGQPVLAPEFSGGQDTSRVAPRGGSSPDQQEIIATQIAEEQVRSMLELIENQFGLTREELLGQETELGLLYRQLVGQLQQARDLAIRDVEGNALARGVFRSGIAAGDRARILQNYANQASAAESERALKLQSIQSALGSLSAEQAAAAQAAAIEIAQAQLGNDVDLATALELINTAQS